MAGKELATTPKRFTVGGPPGSGRPSSYTLEWGKAICERIAAGETLIEVCQTPGYPKEATVRGWDLLDRAEEGTGSTAGFAAMYARARAMQIEHEVDSISIMARIPVMGETKTVKSGPNGTEVSVTQADAVAHRRLYIDTMKWRASKIAAKHYGDRLLPPPEVGGDASQEIKVVISGGLPSSD